MQGACPSTVFPEVPDPDFERVPTVSELRCFLQSQSQQGFPLEVDSGQSQVTLSWRDEAGIADEEPTSEAVQFGKTLATSIRRAFGSGVRLGFEQVDEWVYLQVDCSPRVTQSWVDAVAATYERNGIWEAISMKARAGRQLEGGTMRPFPGSVRDTSGEFLLFPFESQHDRSCVRLRVATDGSVLAVPNKEMRSTRNLGGVDDFVAVMDAVRSEETVKEARREVDFDSLSLEDVEANIRNEADDQWELLPCGVEGMPFLNCELHGLYRPSIGLRLRNRATPAMEICLEMGWEPGPFSRKCPGIRVRGNFQAGPSFHESKSFFSPGRYGYVATTSNPEDVFRMDYLKGVLEEAKAHYQRHSRQVGGVRI